MGVWRTILHPLQKENKSLAPVPFAPLRTLATNTSNAENLRWYGMVEILWWYNNNSPIFKALPPFWESYGQCSEVNAHGQKEPESLNLMVWKMKQLYYGDGKMQWQCPVVPLIQPMRTPNSLPPVRAYSKCIYAWADNKRIWGEEVSVWVYAFWVCKRLFYTWGWFI